MPKDKNGKEPSTILERNNAMKKAMMQGDFVSAERAQQQFRKKDKGNSTMQRFKKKGRE